MDLPILTKILLAAIMVVRSIFVKTVTVCLYKSLQLFGFFRILFDRNIFLVSAVRLIGNSHSEETCVQQWLQILIGKVLDTPIPTMFGNFSLAPWFSTEHYDFILDGDLGGILGGTTQVIVIFCAAIKHNNKAGLQNLELEFASCSITGIILTPYIFPASLLPFGSQ